MNKSADSQPSTAKNRRLHPWAWVPSLYFAEGLPYVAVNTLSVVLYTDTGISNDKMALLTSLLYLPWVLKFIWSPFVDVLRTKRWWIIAMQAVMAIGLGLVALLIPFSWYLAATLVLFWITAFASATHDIAADGFYMLAMSERQQSYFVGVRSTFYRFATIFAQGVLVVLAGLFEDYFGSKTTAWSLVFLIASAILAVIALYHAFALPRPTIDKERSTNCARDIWNDIGKSFGTFFSKRGIVIAIIFLLLYRLPEALMLKLANPFMLDSPEDGGLGLTKAAVGTAYGIFGVIGLLAGGIVGGIAASIGGLKLWIKPMALAMSLTCLTFLILSYLSNPSFFVVTACIVIEQFGYGFGFSAYMLYMLYISRGEYATSHYAICTAFMAASMMLPGLVAGIIQEAVGYQMFFWICIACCTATIAVASIVKIDGDFGRKRS